MQTEMQRKARRGTILFYLILRMQNVYRKKKGQHRQAQVNGSEKSGIGRAERGPTRKWWGPLLQRGNRGLVGPNSRPSWPIMI